MLALLSHPDQLATVQADHSLIPNVVEETLRYDGSIQGLLREATEDVELSSTTIPAGSVVFPIFASANHDETQFKDAERFDVRRNAKGHLAFGFGTHFCLGAPLARLECLVALQELFARYPSIQRADDKLNRVDAMLLRGLKSLPLVVRDDAPSQRPPRLATAEHPR